MVQNIIPAGSRSAIQAGASLTCYRAQRLQPRGIRRPLIGGQINMSADRGCGVLDPQPLKQQLDG